MGKLGRLAILFTVAAMAGCGSQRTTFTSKAGNYRVLMPGTPTEMEQDQTTQAGIIRMHLATAHDRDFSYNVTYADFREGTVQPEVVDNMLDGAATGAVAMSKSKEISRKPITLGTHPGREVVFEAAGTGGAAKGIGRLRIYLVGDRMYEVLVLGPESKATTSATDPYLDSFALLNGPNMVGDLVETPPPAGGSTPPPASSTAEAAPRVQIPGWGGFLNPLGDCRAEVRDGALEVLVPGTYHDFSAQLGAFDAPRILQDVSGDFVADVQVPDALEPSGQCTRPGGVPYNGAGLLFWIDNTRYLRLEKAAILRGDTVMPYLLLEATDRGRNPSPGNVGAPPDASFLRFRRRGGVVSAFVSSDGRDWFPLPGINAEWTGPAKIGVMAINSADSPFTARFRGLKIKSPGPP